MLAVRLSEVVVKRELAFPAGSAGEWVALRGVAIAAAAVLAQLRLPHSDLARVPAHSLLEDCRHGWTGEL